MDGVLGPAHPYNNVEGILSCFRLSWIKADTNSEQLEVLIYTTGTVWRFIRFGFYSLLFM